MQKEESKYFITVDRNNDNAVELWAEERLPFEPNGWKREMGDSLRSALKGLKGIDGGVLHAIYQSENQDRFDIENVLLYNVGASAFSRYDTKGLYLERRFAPIPPISNTNLSDIMPYHCYKHYYCYRIVQRETIAPSKKGNIVLAQWNNIPFPPICGENKPHIYWYVMKTGSIHIATFDWNDSFLSLELLIKTPSETKLHLAAVVKPLLDGIVSAFHAHDGSDIDNLSNRLAALLSKMKKITKKITIEKIKEMLYETDKAVLGTRNLLYKFKNGIQWNPADDRFVVIDINIENSIRENQWFVSGKIAGVKRFIPK